MKVKAALSASIGGAFEWYDFVIYGFFVQFFGDQFFPQQNSSSERVIAFSIFAIGFFARPFGGLLFGHIGDVYGRSKSLYYSMILIGIATFTVAIMPTYNQIGGYSTILFIIFRICQGFAIGGSISGSFIYISELSTPHSRSFWVSTTFIGTMRGIILAGVISSILFAYLTTAQLHLWGWRVAFLFGTLIIIVAKYSGTAMIETPYHNKLALNNQLVKSPLTILFKQYKWIILQCIGLTAIHAVLTMFILLFMPIFLQYYGMNHKDALHINLLTIIAFSTILPLFGWFGNKTSLNKMLFSACVILILFTYPALTCLASHSTFTKAIGVFILILADCIVSAALPPIIVSLFPTGIRYSGVSFSYNLCVAFFAGLSPIVITIIGNRFHSMIISTTIIIVAAATITLFSTFIPKTRHMPVARKKWWVIRKQADDKIA